MQEGMAQYYATGNLSGRFGVFFAQRIGSPQSAQGVIVVKFEFDRLVDSWEHDTGESFVISPAGIIIAATDRTQDLLTLYPLEATTAAGIRQSGQFQGGALTPSRYVPQPDGMYQLPDGRKFAGVEQAIAGTDLKLLHIENIALSLRSAHERAMLATLIFLIFAFAVCGLAYWRITRAGRIEADRRALEQAVVARTAQLSAEMAQRQRSEERLRDARDALEQANRLATLGSITAGLVHEVNQPVATIRTLSENARHHLGAGKTEKVAGNLDAVIDLTERIGRITQQMRRFARRGRGEMGPVEIGVLVDSSLALMEERLRNVHVTFEPVELAGYRVMGERVRLEQVLINLLQNAAEAMEDRSDATLLITLQRRGAMICVTIADNGPGIAPEMLDEIFNPFITAKPEGLGLGLSIARDIVAEFDGSLHVQPGLAGGASFELCLRCNND